MTAQYRRAVEKHLFGDVSGASNLSYQIALRSHFMQPDEVRYEEDMKPLGLDFIQLGLNDVLCFPESGEIYTPNTNQKVEVDRRSEDVIKKPVFDPETHQIIDNEPDGEGGGLGDSGLTDGGESGIISLEDEYVSHSIGAKRPSYDIMDLETGEHFDLVDGSYIRQKEIFAGKGSSEPYRKADKYAKKFHNKPEDWSHVKGIGTVDYYGEEREAELHWSECKEHGKVDIFIKRWLDEG